MRLPPLLFVIVLLSVTHLQARGPDEYRQLSSVEQLPRALDRAFEFRKVKLFTVGDLPGVPNRSGGASRDPSIGFEASYRLFGAVTELDKRRRYGHYFDIYWRAKKTGPVTVRLEYRQEKLRTLTQAREVDYAKAKGSHRTSFAIVGDDFFNDGRVLAWRALLIAQGRIVAEERSYLWH